MQTIDDTHDAPDAQSARGVHSARATDLRLTATQHRTRAVDGRAQWSGDGRLAEVVGRFDHPNITRIIYVNCWHERHGENMIENGAHVADWPQTNLSRKVRRRSPDTRVLVLRVRE